MSTSSDYTVSDEFRSELSHGRQQRSIAKLGEIGATHPPHCMLVDRWSHRGILSEQTDNYQMLRLWTAYSDEVV
jgi:hypothetical protein